MFAEIPETTKFRRPTYVRIKEGHPVLFQFLDDSAERFLVHNIFTSDRKLAKVVHDDDSEIMSEEWFNEQYRPRWMFRVNVLDVTPHVMNPTTGTKINALSGGVPERDPVDGSSLKEFKPQPLNEVKILERGVTLFKQFNAIISSLKVSNPNLDPRQVVFQIQASGSGRNMTTSVFPRTDIEPQPLDDYETFDLELESFSDEEINLMLRGTGLMKIYEARRQNVEENLPEIGEGKLDFTGGLPGLN